MKIEEVGVAVDSLRVSKSRGEGADQAEEDESKTVTLDVGDEEAKETRESFTLQWNISLSVPIDSKKKRPWHQRGGKPPRLPPVLEDDLEGTQVKDKEVVEVDDLMLETNGSPDPTRKMILDQVVGQAKSGSMLALMGASGAGKTTLLDCMSLRNRKYEGEVFIDKEPVGDDFYATTAYVYQMDLFFPTLTVREHLTFHAMVRVGEKVAKAERLARVEEVIQAVGLKKCADSLIGGPESLIRGISGGERKRLSVATELLSDPAIIFADEPTSGLDAFMALAVCKILRNLSRQGKLVICVIHQPSSEIFELFTDLLLLAKGRTAYLGRRADAVGCFGNLGYNCPKFYNPADFLIEELAVTASRYKKGMVKLKRVTEAYASSDLAEANGVWMRDAPPPKQRFFVTKSYVASALTQFVQTYKRSLKSYAREPVLTRVRFAQALSMGTILGLVYFKQELVGIPQTRNKAGALFLLVMNQSIASIFTVSQAIPKDLTVFMREYLTGANRPSTYFLGLTMAEFPYQVLFPCIFGTLAYWLIGFTPDVAKYLTFLLIMVLTANASCSLGYALSTLTAHEGAAVALGPVLILPMSLYAGLLHSSGYVPIYFLWLDRISMIKYGFQALIINEYTADRYTTIWYGQVHKWGEVVFAMLKIESTQLWYDIGILVVLLIGFRLLALFFLVVRCRMAIS